MSRIQPRKRDGFAGQTMWVAPPPLVRQCCTQPLLQSLIPKDLGWFPNAANHYRERPNGAEEHILIYCSAGCGGYEIGEERGSLHAGEALLIPRHAPHRYWADDATPWSIHWVHFSGIEGDLILGQLPRDHHMLQVDAKSAAVIESLFGELYIALAGGIVMHRLIYGAQVLHHLLGRLLFANTCYSPLQRAHQARTLEPILAYIHENSREPITLKQMAERAGLSISHLSTLFKEQTGLSPMDYFIRYRMQRACALLKFDSRSVQEIAYEVGYEDPYYFSRLFKKVIGVSPLHFRKSLVQVDGH